MSEIGYIFLDNVGNVCFKANNLNVSVRALDMLTDLYSVESFTKNGYIVLNTNYGEEFYHLGEILKLLGVYDSVEYKRNLDPIKMWVIKRGKR